MAVLLATPLPGASRVFASGHPRGPDHRLSGLHASVRHLDAAGVCEGRAGGIRGGSAGGRRLPAAAAGRHRHSGHDARNHCDSRVRHDPELERVHLRADVHPVSVKIHAADFHRNADHRGRDLCTIFMAIFRYSNSTQPPIRPPMSLDTDIQRTGSKTWWCRPSEVAHAVQEFGVRPSGRRRRPSGQIWARPKESENLAVPQWPGL